MIDNLSLIVAIGKNNELGLNNNLIWHLKGDMKFFKETTINHTVIMGRKTFESLPHLLLNRKHIIITTNIDLKINDVMIMNSEYDVLNYVKSSKEECFIIGGASIYKEYLPYCRTLYITEIDAESIADVYFPTFEQTLYKKEILNTLKEDNINYSFVKYTKKTFN